MWYVGIDLHRRTVVIAMVSDEGKRIRPRHFKCSDTAGILKFVCERRPFRAVIEASSSYRWLYDPFEKESRPRSEGVVFVSAYPRNRGPAFGS